MLNKIENKKYVKLSKTIKEKKQNRGKYKSIELFAGAGGLALGLEKS